MTTAVFLLLISLGFSLLEPGIAVPTIRMPLCAKDLTDSALFMGLDEPADLRPALEPLLRDIFNLLLFESVENQFNS